jgi:hypothetical protein
MALVAKVQRDSLGHFIKEHRKPLESLKNLDPKVEYSLQDLIPHWGDSSTSTAATLGSSFQSLQNGSYQFTEGAGGFHDSILKSRASGGFDPSLFDIDAQLKEWEFFEQQKRASEEDSACAAQLLRDERVKDEEDELNDNTIEVLPGLRMPLRDSFETWQAILNGHVTVARCYSCSNDLTCINDAELVFCADCSVCSPVDHIMAAVPAEEDHESRLSGVCIGVKQKDIIQWMNSEEEET